METLSIFHLQYIKLQHVRLLWMKLPFMDHRNSKYVVVVLGWIFSCNEQSAVSVTCWGDQTSFIPRANKPHRLCCQKHHPFNRDKSERRQPAYCHTASTALQSLANRLRGRLIKPIYLHWLFVMSLSLNVLSFKGFSPFLNKSCLHVYVVLLNWKAVKIKMKKSGWTK